MCEQPVSSAPRPARDVDLALDVALAPVADLAALAPRWQAMHSRVGGSAFQSWNWLGCCAAERFDDPVLLEAREAGRTVALGLFNRRRGLRPRAHLGETGDPAADSVFVEHNGFLVDHPARAAVIRHCLRAALVRFGGRLVLAGVDGDHLQAARGAGAMRLRMSRPAPCVDLGAVRAAGPFARLSANTRYQLRRALREAAPAGRLAIARAGSVAEAGDWLDALAALHQATWRARGRPGAFAEPAFARFHRAFVARGHATGEADLLRATADGAVVGYLYNLVASGRVCAYQSGFDYAAGGPHAKPGLVCHHLAIAHYAAAGLGLYDFLAGADRYKLSLAEGGQTLHWLELARLWSAEAAAMRARAAAPRLRRLWRGLRTANNL